MIPPVDTLPYSCKHFCLNYFSFKKLLFEVQINAKFQINNLCTIAEILVISELVMKVYGRGGKCVY